MRVRLRPRGPVISVSRALVSCGIGLAVGGVVAITASPELLFLVSWTTAAIMAMAWVWLISWPQDHLGTERLAEEEGRSYSTDGGVLFAAVVSLAGVAFGLVRTSSGQDAIAVAVAALSVCTVLASWALVNTVFALKYARHYYVQREGGIDFKQETPPAYSDFAYMAFTVGMSYSVSEYELNNTALRKVVFGHAMLSYVFGTGVLAMAINLVSNLGQRS